MKRFVGLQVLFSALLLVLIATNLGLSSEKITVTDTANRSVVAPLDPQRIICLSSGTLRLICFLKATERVVGIEDFEKTRQTGRPYILANPELTKLPTIGPGGPGSINHEPNLEAVLKVKPDVIFISYMEPANADALQKKLNIPVVVLTHGRFASFDERVYDSLRAAGKILKREQRAEDVISFIESARQDLKKRTEGVDQDKKPTVYVGAVGYKGVQGIESTDASYTPLEWVGAKNIAKQIAEKDHLFIDKEKILSLNPDIIIIDGGGLALVKQDYLKNKGFYKGLKAFQNGNVYIIHPFNYYVTNIGTAIADAYAVGKILYPDRFADIDLSNKADEIFVYLLGRPVYNQMKQDFGDLGMKANFDQ